jgi:hypothetical protein
MFVGDLIYGISMSRRDAFGSGDTPRNRVTIEVITPSATNSLFIAAGYGRDVLSGSGALTEVDARLGRMSPDIDIAFSGGMRMAGRALFARSTPHKVTYELRSDIGYSSLFQYFLTIGKAAVIDSGPALQSYWMFSAGIQISSPRNRIGKGIDSLWNAL